MTNRSFVSSTEAYAQGALAVSIPVGGAMSASRRGGGREGARAAQAEVDLLGAASESVSLHGTAL